MATYHGTVGYVKDPSLHLSDVTLLVTNEDECVRLCRANPDCKLAVWYNGTDNVRGETGSCVNTLIVDANTIQYVDTESTPMPNYTTHIKPNCHAKCKDIRNDQTDADVFSRSDGVCRYWRCETGYCANNANTCNMDCRPCAYETSDE